MQANSQTEFLWLVSQGLFSSLSEGKAAFDSIFQSTVAAPAVLVLIGGPQKDDSCKSETGSHFLGFCILDLKRTSQNQIIWTRRETQYSRSNFFFP